MKKLLLLCLALALAACGVQAETSSHSSEVSTSILQDGSSSAYVPNEESSSAQGSSEIDGASEAEPETEFWINLGQMIYTNEKLSGTIISHTPRGISEGVHYDDGTTTFSLGEESTFPLYYEYIQQDTGATGLTKQIVEEIMTSANGSQNWVRIYYTGSLLDEDWEKCANGTKRLSDLLKAAYHGEDGFWAKNQYGDILVDFDVVYKSEQQRVMINIRLNQAPVKRTSLQTFLTSNTQFQKEFIEKVGNVEDIELLVMNDMYSCGQPLYIVVTPEDEFIFTIEDVAIPEWNIMEYDYSSINMKGGTLIRTSQFAEKVIQCDKMNPYQPS